jgi:SpoIID/LytB domain protein
VTHLKTRLIALILVGVAGMGHGAELLSEQSVAIQLLKNVEVVTVFSATGMTVSDATETFTFPAGLYEFSAQSITPPEEQFHLFSKSFQLDDPISEREYIQSWRDQGYPTTTSITIGKELITDTGRSLDARVHWISLVQAPTLAEVTRQQKILEKQEQWTWMRPSILKIGSGTVKLEGPEGSYSLTLPITVESPKPLAVANVDVGFWNERLKNLAYTGKLELTFATGGGLELLEHTPVEEYLRGVLPSEMPALWPEEALKAQAVSARTEVLVNLSTKHSLERFDFCNTEHCRAYHGLNQYAEQTDRALEQTRGRVLVQNNGLVPTVFSANCGGYTASNDTVWSGPPNAALRATSDTPKSSTASLSTTTGVQKWLSSSNNAFCRDDPAGFRWTRDYSEAEIHGMIGKKVTVGRIDRIELGDRGVGGRLKWIRIHGSSGSEVINKELPIRQALGGLPSALFTLTVSGTAPNRRFHISGAGRGHGVGLCQHGARGMALAGHPYTSIVKHYFTDVEIEKVR